MRRSGDARSIRPSFASHSPRHCVQPSRRRPEAASWRSPIGPFRDNFAVAHNRQVIADFENIREIMGDQDEPDPLRRRAGGSASTRREPAPRSARRLVRPGSGLSDRRFTAFDDLHHLLQVVGKQANDLVGIDGDLVSYPSIRRRRSELHILATDHCRNGWLAHC